jgi:type II secretory ATPase GspE/PulE/Tfp pilus assembly ATPase PilB-like protein
MSLSVAQRLVPKVCTNCGEIKDISDAAKTKFEQWALEIGEDHLKAPARYRHINPEGCECCKLGMKGMVPVVELLPFTRRVKDAAHSIGSGDPHARKVLAEARLTTLLSEGLLYVEAGLVDLQSVLYL